MGTELLVLMIGESDDGDRDHGPDEDPSMGTKILIQRM
jgi:hypothetical protein